MTQAQQVMPTIGWLGRTRPEDQTELVAAFRQGLQAAGLVENLNVAVDYRWADGQDSRLPGLASDLVNRRVSVIAAITANSAVAAKAATSTIPIVFLAGSDPVRLGLVSSLNRPGGNATGATLFTHTLDAKRLELVRELVPASTAVAYVTNRNNPRGALSSDEMRSAGQAIGQEIHVFNASTESEIDTVFAAIARLRPNAIVVGGDSFLHSRRQQLLKLTAELAIPAIWEWRDFAAGGGLISYGTILAESLRHVGSYAGRILKGEKASELPVQQPTKFELVINLRTARALGITVPLVMMARADEVIE